MADLPAEAYLNRGQGMENAFTFFKKNGFMMLPDAVPQELLLRARAAVEKLGAEASTCPEVVKLLELSGIWSIVEKLVVDPLPVTRAQVSIVPRVPGTEPPGYFPSDLHIDGVFEDGHINNFALLVGVPLDPFPEPFMGNFGVFPGSHLRLEDLFREKGPQAFQDWMKGSKNWHAEWRARLQEHFAADPFLLLRARPGQAYLVHFQVVHFYHLNLKGADPRRVLYFRVWPRRGLLPGGSPKTSEPEALADIWREFRVRAV